LLLTALLLAADRVDSTTGLQMAYLKDWSPRSYQPLELRVPELIAGPGRACLAG
jgi:adenine-specific DNA-methyltransferase